MYSRGSISLGLILAIIIGIALLGGAGWYVSQKDLLPDHAHENTVATKSDLKVYTDTQHAFAVMYPSHLTPNTENMKLPGVEFLEKGTAKGDISVLDIYINDSVSSCLATPPSRTANPDGSPYEYYSNIATSTINGVEYLSFSVTDPHSSYWKSRIYRTIHNGNCYILERNDQTASTFDPSIAVELDSIVRSFRFTK